MVSSTVCSFEHIGNETFCDYIDFHCDPHFFFAAKTFYCSLNYPSLAWTISFSGGLLIVIGILVALLGLIVSNYLLYCVTNFTELLGINHKVLSFFVVPLTNSLPDLFNYHTAIQGDSVDLALGQVIGANLITFTIIIGLICIICPFSVRGEKGIIIGLVWALIMILILAFVLSDSRINFLECSLICTLFFCYTWSLYILDEHDDTKTLEIEAVVSNKGMIVNEAASLIQGTSINANSDLEYREIYQSRSQRVIDFIADVIDHVIFIFIPISKRTLHRLKRNEHSFKNYLFGSHFFHIWMIFVSCLLLNFNVLHFSRIGFGVTTLLLCSVFEVLRRYVDEDLCNILVDIASICNSLGIISFLTSAVIELLKNLGSIWKISEYTMGLLVFSIVNSINDIAMNVLLSKNVSPELGVHSCFGTCLILILLGIGFSGLWKLLSSTSGDSPLKSLLHFTLSPEIYLSTISLILIVGFDLLYLPLNGWKMDRKMGIFSICAWVATTVVCLYFDFRLNS